MTGSGWRIEWAVALRRRRLLLFDVLVPLLLVTPLVWAGAPVVHEAAIVAVLVVIFGVFGSAIPLVRDGRSGLLLRWWHAGVPPRSYLGGRLLAQAGLDLLQLLPALGLVALAGGGSPARWILGGAHVALALVAANALGAWSAALARSLAEAALFSAVVGLLALHLSGAFRTPAAGTTAALLEAWAPFRGLHEALLFVTAGVPPGASFPGNASGLLPPFALFLLTVVAAPVLHRRLLTPEE